MEKNNGDKAPRDSRFVSKKGDFTFRRRKDDEKKILMRNINSKA